MERYKNFLLIDEPHLSLFSNFRIGKSKPLRNKVFATGGYRGWSSELPPLPEAHYYTIVGKGDELTEEQWEKIIGIEERYPDFTKRYFVFDTPKESGLSLLKSKGMKPETTLIIQDNGTK